jgi:hypothetical protein
VDTLPPTALGAFYKPGTISAPGSCTTAEINQLAAQKTIADLVNAVGATSAACQACAYTADGDAATAWAPLVKIPNGGAPIDIPSWGTCVAGKSTQACGELEQKFQLCFLEACELCAPGDEDACQDAAYGSVDAVCQKFASDLFAKGGCDAKAFDSAEKACGSSLATHIKAHCGP